MWQKILPVVLLIAVLIGVIFIFSKDNTQKENSQISTTEIKNMEKTHLTPPPMMLNKDKQYEAVLQTSEGDITIQLNSLVTPITE